MPCHIFPPNRSAASIQEFDVEAGNTAEGPLDKNISDACKVLHLQCFRDIFLMYVHELI